MTNNSIGRVLKYYRKLNNLSVDEVSSYLSEHEYPAATKTIYGWENDHTQPNTETLMLLCSLYNIQNILEAFGYSNKGDLPSLRLTTHEEKLVKKYREHPELQTAVDRILEL